MQLHSTWRNLTHGNLIFGGHVGPIRGPIPLESSRQHHKSKLIQSQTKFLKSGIELWSLKSVWNHKIIGRKINSNSNQSTIELTHASEIPNA